MVSGCCGLHWLRSGCRSGRKGAEEPSGWYQMDLWSDRSANAMSKACRVQCHRCMGHASSEPPQTCLLRGIYAADPVADPVNIDRQLVRGPGAPYSLNHVLPLRCRKGTVRPGCQRLGTPATG